MSFVHAACIPRLSEELLLWAELNLAHAFCVVSGCEKGSATQICLCSEWEMNFC